METKQYLNQIGRFELMIKNKMSELSTLKEIIYGLEAVSSEEKVQKTPNHDKIGTSVSRIDTLEREIDSLIDEYANKRFTIISQIDKMENEDVYNILFLRYVGRKTFEIIATEMGYSYRQITRLHGRALKDFETKYGSEYL